MPKVILEFQLPEETDEYELAMQGHAAAAFIDDWENVLRNMYKYETHPTQNRGLTASEHKIVVEIREAFYNLKRDSGLI